MTPTGLFLLALAWLAYFALHSWLASLTCKQWVAKRWPGFMPAYRLVFNLLAVVLLVPFWPFLFHGPHVIAWTGVWAWLNLGFTVAIGAALVWSIRLYDNGEFLGLRQWREQRRAVLEQEPFRISPAHRFVRHPWYFLGLLFLWTRDMNEAFLLSAGLMTVYLALGSRWEEHKLLVYHGEPYAEYRRRVPGLFPLPWRWLTREQARALTRQANHYAGRGL